MAAAPQQQWQRDMGRAMAGEVQEYCVPPPLLRPLKRTYDICVADYGKPIPLDEESHRVKRAVKLATDYRPVLHQPTLQWNMREKGGPSTLWDPHGHEGWAAEYLVTDTQPWSSCPGVPWTAYSTVWRMPSESAVQSSAVAPPASQEMDAIRTAAGVGDIYWHPGISGHLQPAGMSVPMGKAGGYTNSAFMPKEAPTMPKPQWHPPWKLHRVISGHEGWVRCVAVEPGNQWFATGSSDKTIKIWDLASGKLKLSMTKHAGVVRGVTVSTRSPHLFSCGGCGQVMCWDIEYNKVIRRYCGHRSVVYGLDLHPTIDVLVTCSSDSTVRVWDPRTKGSVHTLLGHTDGVAAVKCQAAEIFTGSHDTTVRIWNLVTAKPRVTLTNHRRAARAIVLHPRYYTFASGAPGDIKQWKIPDGDFIQTLSGHKAVINTLAVNSDDVLVSGAGDGSVCFWDWTTGHIFQRVHAAAKPDSWHSDSGIFACAFDQSGRTLLTAGTEKTIKVYKEDDTATEENHPLS